MKTTTKVFSALMLLAAAPISASAQTKPDMPVDVKAEVQGLNVSLSWNNAAIGDVIAENGFEDAAFPGEGWSIKTTDTANPCFTWFQYPTEKYLVWTNYEQFIYSGEKSAYLNFDLFVPRPEGSTSSAHQDEWLISPKVAGASYLTFQFFINPTLLDNGVYEDFPNDYYVKVSRDGGTTWENIWNARYDMLYIDGYQQAVVCLGEPSDDMMVAFAATSSPDITDRGLYYSWALDEVKFYSGNPGIQAGAVEGKNAPASANTYREFDTTGKTPSAELIARRDARRNVAKAPYVYRYNVYLDGEPVGFDIHALSFTDSSEKEFGTHTYGVTAIGADGTESDPAEIEVELVFEGFPAPRNLVLMSDYDAETESYTVHGAWEAPEGTFQPFAYEAFGDGQSCAWVNTGEELEFTQTWVPAGTYRYDVLAHYDNPYGDSDMISQWITVGCRSTVTGFSAETEGSDVVLSWGKPTDPDYADLKGFRIVRGTETIAEGITELTYTDKDVAPGIYRYMIYCDYNDGTSSQPKYTDVQSGELVAYTLPHYEGFNSGNKPVDWQSVSPYDSTPQEYRFCFDDRFGLEMSGSGFDGGYVSASSEAAGFMFVAAALVSPLYDLSGIADRSELTIGFAYDYLSEGEGAVAVEYSTDEGQEWFPVDEMEPSIPYYTPDEMDKNGGAYMPMEYLKNVSAIATVDKIMFRVFYTGYLDYHFALDNWKFYDGKTGGIGGVVPDDETKVIIRGNRATVVTTEAVEKIEVYDPSGRLIGSSTHSDSVDLTDGNGICIIKATTANGSNVYRVAR